MNLVILLYFIVPGLKIKIKQTKKTATYPKRIARKKKKSIKIVLENNNKDKMEYRKHKIIYCEWLCHRSISLNWIIVVVAEHSWIPLYNLHGWKVHNDAQPKCTKKRLFSLGTLGFKLYSPEFMLVDFCNALVNIRNAVCDAGNARLLGHQHKLYSLSNLFFMNYLTNMLKVQR